MSTASEEIRRRLALERHPTCGFVAETYRSTIPVPATALPASYGGGRPLGSALYFLVMPEAPIVLHRIRSDQQYHHYLGDALEVLLLMPDGLARRATVGKDLAAGMAPQLFIPGGTFHMARLRAGGEFALLGSTEWPGVEPSKDVELGDLQALSHDYPDLAAQLARFEAA